MGPVALTGEVWASSSINMPTDDKFILSSLYSQLAMGRRNPMFARFAQPVVDQIAALKELPLSSKISVTVTMRGQPHTVTTTYDVKSLSTDPLEDSLFHAPDDYAHIDAPMPMFGGGPGAPGGAPGGPGGPMGGPGGPMGGPGGPGGPGAPGGAPPQN